MVGKYNMRELDKLRKKIQGLHCEMHFLKQKISQGSINNENTTELEARLNEILKELGYKNQSNRRKAKYRYVPSKCIKVYYDGTCNPK